MNNEEIFSKVLTVGPSLKSLGGMASVLRIYKDYIPGFKHIATNSPRGTVAGIFPMLAAMFRLPIERLRGRKILHVHAASGKSHTRKSVLIAEARLLGYKVVFHTHSGAFQNSYGYFGIQRVKRINSKVSAIVALSKPWVEYYSNAVPASNIRLLYNPITLPANVSHPNSTNPLRLLFMGMINDLKGIFDLLEVLAENKERWRGRVHLTIGGSGEVERLYDCINKLGIKDIVNFIGWVDGDDKEKAFADSHVLILPSYTEGLPMSILEAMIRHKPVISTPVGGIPEVVTSDENGFLVKSGDKKAIARAIDCYLLNPELIKRHGQVSAERSVEFRPDTILPRLVEIYRSVLSKK